MRDSDACHLAECMDTGIGSTGAKNGERVTFDLGQRSFESLLHRIGTVLTLPAGVTGSVVRDCQLEGPHGFICSLSGRGAIQAC